MKHRRAYQISCMAFFLLLSMSVVSKSKAQYPPGNWPEDEESSKEAGDQFYQALSGLYLAVGDVTQNYIEIANGKVAEIAKSFSRVTELYKTIEGKVSEKERIEWRKIAPAKIQEINKDIQRLNKDFAGFKIESFQTRKQLATFNKEQVKKFEEFLNKIGFVQVPAQNRRQIKTINERIFQIMTLGYYISEVVTGSQ